MEQRTEPADGIEISEERERGDERREEVRRGETPRWPLSSLSLRLPLGAGWE
jgi:hypothetical protein